jgi:hypothetical protein
MRNFGWVGPPTDGTPKPMGSQISDDPANRRVQVGSTPDAKQGKGYAPVVGFPEGNENGIKLITGTTNHKTKMGARRAAKGMVRDNSEYLLNTKGGVPKRESTEEERASRDTFW